MQNYYGGSGEPVDVDYTNVLSEIEDDNELEIVDTPNLDSELSDIEITSDSYLTSKDNFFSSSGEVVLIDDIKDEDLYSSEELVVVDKNKLMDMTKDTVRQTALHMSDVLKSISTLGGISKTYLEDRSEIKEYVDSTYSNVPSFVNSSVQSQVFWLLQNNKTTEEIFELCDLEQSDKNNEAKKYIFMDWIDGLQENLGNLRKSRKYSDNVNRKSQEVLLGKLFSGINISDSYKALLNSDNRDVYTTFYTDGSRVTHFKCNNCSSDGEPYLAKLQDDFIVITNINGKPGFLVTPSICDKCGTFHLLSPTTLKDFASKCKSIGLSLTSGSIGYNGLRIATYKPSFIETSNLLSLYYNIEIIPGVDVSNSSKTFFHEGEGEVKDIQYDWDSICKEFRELNVMIGDSIFKLNNKEDSLNNIAKIVSNQLDSYPRLKENAIASLILTLEKDGLFKFSLESKCYYEVYSKIKDLSKVSTTAMKNLSDVFYYKLVNDDDSINYDLSSEVFNNIRDNYSKLEEDKQDFLFSLDRYKYFLSYIPISKIDLREDMVYNYLSDPSILKSIDEISDLMILNHLAEELFESLNIPAKKQIKSVNRKKPLIEYVSKIAEFFGVQCHSILNLLDNPDAINTLSSFLDSCYREDLYDMYKFKNNMMVLDPSYCHDEIKELFEFIMIFPSKDLKMDKFSFYFDFDCDISYKARFVKMYETRGFIPKELKGDTVEEKLDYYSKCPKSLEKDLIPGNVRKLLNNYSNIIMFGRFISYRGMYKDFGSYYCMRDILFESKDYPIKSLLNALSIEPTMSSLLLEEDYSIPDIDYDIVKDFIYLVLPIFDPELEDRQNDTSKSYRDRINYVIENVDGLISQYKGLDELESLLSELIKDLANRKN